MSKEIDRRKEVKEEDLEKVNGGTCLHLGASPDDNAYGEGRQLGRYADKSDGISFDDNKRPDFS